MVVPEYYSVGCYFDPDIYTYLQDYMNNQEQCVALCINQKVMLNLLFSAHVFCFMWTEIHEKTS